MQQRVAPQLTHQRRRPARSPRSYCRQPARAGAWRAVLCVCFGAATHADEYHPATKHCCCSVNPGWQPNFTLAYNNTGVYNADTLESTMFRWKGALYMMEGILGCSFWQNHSTTGASHDPAFANNSYIRISEVGSGRVVANIPRSQGYGFPNAVVDYDNDRLWVFATANDRCGRMPTRTSRVDCVTTDCIQAFQTTDLLTWRSAKAGGTEGVTVPNVDVARVRMSAADAAMRGLPPHRWIMILEGGWYGPWTNESTPQFMINNGDDLTTGWAATQYQITDHGSHSVGCPSVRYMSDGFYYAVTGMGAWNGVVRSWNLVNWTYGRNTGEGWHSGAVNRPGYGDGRLGPYNAWLSDNVPDYLRVNLDRENLPLWDGNNNDPDVCCGDSKHEFSPAYIVYGVSSQGATPDMGFFPFRYFLCCLL